MLVEESQGIVYNIEQEVLKSSHGTVRGRVRYAVRLGVEIVWIEFDFRKWQFQD